MTHLTHDRLLERISYDPQLGEFRSRLSGDRIGWINDRGWRKIEIDGKKYRAARLAFFYMTGRWPHPTVDHKNRNRSDDRWENLKEAEFVEQIWNRPQKPGVSGESHIYSRRGKFVVRIKLPSLGRVRLGRYDSIEEAVKVRDKYLSDRELGVV